MSSIFAKILAYLTLVSVVQGVSLNWNTLHLSLTLLADELSNLGFAYVNGEIITSQYASDSSYLVSLYYSE